MAWWWVLLWTWALDWLVSLPFLWPCWRLSIQIPVHPDFHTLIHISSTFYSEANFPSAWAVGKERLIGERLDAWVNLTWKCFCQASDKSATTNSFCAYERKCNNILRRSFELNEQWQVQRVSDSPINQWLLIHTSLVVLLTPPNVFTKSVVSHELQYFAVDSLLIIAISTIKSLKKHSINSTCNLWYDNFSRYWWQSLFTSLIRNGGLQYCSIIHL